MTVFQRVREEVEAHLEPAGGASASASGKSEWKRYADGEERLEVKARGLDLPEGTMVTIVIGGRSTADVDVQGGRVRFDVRSSDGEVPVVQVGESIELRAGGVTHLIGKYRPD